MPNSKYEAVAAILFLAGVSLFSSHPKRSYDLDLPEIFSDPPQISPGYTGGVSSHGDGSA